MCRFLFCRMTDLHNKWVGGTNFFSEMMNWGVGTEQKLGGWVGHDSQQGKPCIVGSSVVSGQHGLALQWILAFDTIIIIVLTYLGCYHAIDPINRRCYDLVWCELQSNRLRCVFSIFLVDATFSISSIPLLRIRPERERVSSGENYGNYLPVSPYQSRMS